MTDQPEGQRFSQVYMRRADLLPDSARMRNRIAKIIGALGDHDDLRSFGQFIEREQGILVGQTVYSYQWPPILQKMELRDVLDTITTIYSAISSYDQGREAQKRKTFLDNCRRVFAEEQVRYRIDDRGGVHLAVDEEFEAARISTISGLGAPRYNGVRSLYDDAFIALDRTPPDGKAALRSAFFATESLFRLIFPSAHQLSSSEIQKHLEPLVSRLYANQKPAISLAQKLVASLKDWIDGAHFYRHEPGAEEPAQPPLELAIYMVSEAGGHLRWLAKLDAMASN
ncbi:hypothetical protein HJA82_02190 [Rhizobium bangladeshense]|uniref:hypothetical protein n=1 Tax=Rhizobium TaxID=379 RepID=UPI001C82A68B|nr:MULTISPECIES: hypothetical protein [Rhizobium]MBX4906196.1 hypothetical protein [Rhizobium bangladeshense]MBX4996728.1 hypothetical protein [Rhizobium lentis]MBX5243322.1 hypothetical protein [Rhizobium sp. NLR3b]MBX5279162.1 hypothetical protein [Rhizobium sp. NLR13a]MBX5285212.1 hypothetical protein [Rhizobium sp. NLR10a]